jgi:hypothetical protein
LSDSSPIKAFMEPALRAAKTRKRGRAGRPHHVMPAEFTKGKCRRSTALDAAALVFF